MRDLQLLEDYLVRLRQERLQLGHQRALNADTTLVELQIYAHEAELCTRIRGAVKALEHDSGKFIEDYLK